MRREVRKMNKRLSRAIEIALSTSPRGRRAFLLSVFWPNKEEYKELLTEVCKTELRQDTGNAVHNSDVIYICDRGNTYDSDLYNTTE